MNKLEDHLNELKAIAQNPRIYLVNYFDEIRNQIDVECQAFLSRSDLASDVYDMAIQQQEELIGEVFLFQRRCLENLEMLVSNDLTEIGQLEQRFNSLIAGDEEASLNVEKDVYCALYDRKKLLFNNKGLIFFSLKDFQKLMKSSYMEIGSDILYGLLFLIEDEFLLDSDEFQLL